MGFRSPYLNTGPLVREVLSDNGFLCDSSVIEDWKYSGQPRLWQPHLALGHGLWHPPQLLHVRGGLTVGRRRDGGHRRPQPPVLMPLAVCPLPAPLLCSADLVQDGTEQNCTGTEKWPGLYEVPGVCAVTVTTQHAYMLPYLRCRLEAR